MRSFCSLLICCLLLASAGCSKSTTTQPAGNTAPVSATPVTGSANAGGSLTQPGQPNNASPAIATSKGEIDVCALLTSKDLQAVQGEPLKETKPSARSEGGFMISQCFYSMPTFTNSISLLVAQKGETAGARDPKEFWKEIFQRAAEEEKERTKEKEKESAGDKDKNKAGAEEEERGAPPQKIAGLGDDAYWTGNRVGGALYALKGNTYIRISVGGPGNQEAKIKKTRTLAQIILKRL